MQSLWAHKIVLFILSRFFSENISTVFWRFERRGTEGILQARRGLSIFPRLLAGTIVLADD